MGDSFVVYIPESDSTVTVPKLLVYPDFSGGVGQIDKSSSKINNPPSRKKKRSSGYGGGYIEYREVKRNHKTYSQYWYHYEFWREGERTTKKSRYIPKRLVQKVERMNGSKVAVRKILEVLRVEGEGD